MDSRKVADAFRSVAQILSGARGMEEICSNVAGLITSDLGFRSCLFILQDAGGRFCITALAGVERDKRLASLHALCPDDGSAFVNHVLINKKTMAVDTLPACFRLSDEQSKAVVSPVTCKGRGIGIMIAECDAIEETDVQLADSIARYVSVGIENDTFYREKMESHVELIHDLETLHLVHEIGKEILSSLKTEEIVATAIQMVRRVIPCDGAAVALFDEERELFSVITSWGTGLERGVEIRKADAPFFAVLESRRSMYQHDITLDFKDYPKQLEWSSEKNVFSYFCMPLSTRERFFGILVLSSVRPAWFTGVYIATAERIATQVSIALENARLLEGVEDVFMGTVRTLVSAIDAKSDWTKGHSLQVAEYAVMLGEKIRLGREALERLKLAAILHDIGKMGTYEAILDKPGELTAEEIRMIRMHPAQGADILSPLRAMRDIIPIIKHHHERYDGSGYPGGLAGDDIPFEARVLAIADVYAAMRSDRPYRAKLAQDAAFDELRRGAGTQFDPRLVELFLDILNAD